MKREKDLTALSPESLEDLWVLTKLVAQGDEASASSLRRVKNLDLTRGDSGEKKRVRLRLRVERVEFAENANKLRVTGVILSGGPEEFVQVGEHHTLDVEINGKIDLHKDLNAFEREILAEAVAQHKRLKACLVVLDDRKATVALLSDRLRFVCELESAASKRDPKGFAAAKSEFYGELAQLLEQQEADNLVVAGPGFAKDDFLKWLKERHPKLAVKTVTGSASTAEKSGVFELLKSGALDKLIAGKKLQEDFQAVEEFKKRLAKGGAACYGLEETKQAVQARAVEVLLVLDELLRRASPLAAEANALLDGAKRGGAKVRVLDSESEAGLEFESFKVGALLRYKLH